MVSQSLEDPITTATVGFISDTMNLPDVHLLLYATVGRTRRNYSKNTAKVHKLFVTFVTFWTQRFRHF